jgi:hypothetical protein
MSTILQYISHHFVYIHTKGEDMPFDGVCFMPKFHLINTNSQNK